MPPRRCFLIAVCLCLFIFIVILKCLKKDEDSLGQDVEDMHFVSSGSFNRMGITSAHISADTHLLRNLTEKQILENRLTNPNLDKSASCGSKPFIVIVIASAPTNYLQRNAIRSSWGSSFSSENLNHQTKKFLQRFISSNFVVKIVFLIGRAKDSEVEALVDIEAQQHRDLVFGDFIEDYRNLTMKTRLGLKWAHYHCKPQYFLKTDDDVFINVQFLVKWLVSKPSEKFYTGWCNFGSQPVRQHGHKWYVSKEDFPGDVYPGYCLGGGYLMSGDVLADVVRLTYGRKHFPMEDLYVGIMVKEIGDVKAVVERSKFNLIYNGRGSTCDLNKLILAHPVEMHKLAEMTLKAVLAKRTCDD